MSDAFPDLQGPAIPISLFGEASTAGTNVGNAVPSTTSAIIQGGIKGMKGSVDMIQGVQQIKANSQNEQIRQNTIEQLPVTNEIQREQLEHAQTANEIEALQLKLAKQTEKLNIDNVKSKLLNETSKNQDELELRQLDKDFAKDLETGGQVAVNAVMGKSRYSRLFSSKKGTYDTGLRAILQNNSASQEQKQQAWKLLQKNSVLDKAEAERLKNEKAWALANGAVDASFQLSEAGRKLGLDTKEVPGRVDMVPFNKFLREKDNPSQLQKDSRGHFIPNPEFHAASSPDVYDIVTPQGLVLSDQAGKEDFEAYKAQRKLAPLFDGTALKRDLGRLEEKPGQSDAVTNRQDAIRAKRQIAQQEAIKRNKEDNKLTPLESEVQLKLNLPLETLKEIKAPLNTIQQEVDKYISYPETKAVEPQIEIDKAINTTSRFIADKEFNESPTLQARFTEANVKIYNDNIKRILGESGVMTPDKKLIRDSYYLMFGGENPLTTLFNQYAVKTPADLYYITSRRQTLEKPLRALVQKNIILGRREQQAAVRKQFSDQSNANLLMSGIKDNAASR